jgi:hypothetical protein
MTATPITSEQTKQFRRFVEDAGDRALKEVALDKEGLQELLENGGRFQDYVLEGVRKFSTKGPVFPVYLDIEVGGKSKDQLLKELKSSGCNVSQWAEDIMSKPAWKPGEKERVKFARAKVRELGFDKPPKPHELFARIRELGHSLCESGDGPAIRLALPDQPRSDWFWCAMEPISDSDGDPRVFNVVRYEDGEQWLYAYWLAPDDELSLENEVVFRLRK